MKIHQSFSFQYFAPNERKMAYLSIATGLIYELGILYVYHHTGLIEKIRLTQFCKGISSGLILTPILIAIDKNSPNGVLPQAKHPFSTSADRVFRIANYIARMGIILALFYRKTDLTIGLCAVDEILSCSKILTRPDQVRSSSLKNKLILQTVCIQILILRLLKAYTSFSSLVIYGGSGWTISLLVVNALCRKNVGRKSKSSPSPHQNRQRALDNINSLYKKYINNQGSTLPTHFTQEELKRRYRKISLKCHPDKTHGSDEDFKKLDSAYQLLKTSS